MKKCPKCMRSDNDSQRFCTHCGTELFFTERFEEPVKPKKKISAWRLSKIFKLLINKNSGGLE